MTSPLEQTSIADELSHLAERRRAKQIGQWEFEESKRQLLNLPRSRVPRAIKNLLACLIVNLTLLGLAIAFPTYARMLAAAMLIVLAYLLVAGVYLRSKVVQAGRRGGHYTRPVDWDYGMKRAAGTTWSIFGSKKRGGD